jgi:hypothetical protein
MGLFQKVMKQLSFSPSCCQLGTEETLLVPEGNQLPLKALKGRSLLGLFRAFQRKFEAALRQFGGHSPSLSRQVGLIVLHQRFQGEPL